MKQIALIFITLLAYGAASEEYEVTATTKKVEQVLNMFFVVSNPPPTPISFVLVRQKISNLTSLKVEYSVTNESGEILGEGTEPFCYDPESGEGSVVPLLGKVLGVNLNCPVEYQRGSHVYLTNTEKISLDKDPGDDQLTIIIAIKYYDEAIITATLDAKTT